MSILQPGVNCQRVTEADCGRFLIDGAAYFEDVYHTLKTAERCVFIIGWDIDSRVQLLRNGVLDDGYPKTLGAFLNRLVEERKDLNIYILTWDYIKLYALDREPFPKIAMGLRTHSRIRFHLDDHHPIWGSHHQKIVVVDDRIAYCGGMDLTAARWDTPRHSPNDPRRIHPRGSRYGPFHDVQVRLEGEAARELGIIARNRWRRVTGQSLPLSPPLGPGSVKPCEKDDFGPVKVGVSLTQPEYMGARELRQIERMLLDLVFAAQRTLYFENQYFASTTLTEAFATRLAPPHGPDIAVVLPSTAAGWLEDGTMGALRNKILTELTQKDRYGRLGFYMPEIDGLVGGVKVHSKLVIVDDTFAMIGSSNLNNRSMGLDTECNVVFDGTENPELRPVLRRLNARLVAEHLGAEADDIEEEMLAGRRLHAILAQRRGQNRRLVRYDPPKNDWLKDAISDVDVIDMKKTLEAEKQFDGLIGSLRKVSFTLLARSSITVGTAAGVLLLFIAIYHSPPLREILERIDPVPLIPNLKVGETGPTMIFLAYVLGAFLFIPLNMLILATASVLSLGSAIFYSLSGALIYAALNYAVGYLVGQRIISRLFLERAEEVAKRLGQYGLLPIFYTRILLWVPYWLVNLVAGAFRTRVSRFLMGTALGTLPGVLGLCVFQYNLLEYLASPNLWNGFVFLIVGVLVGAWIVACRRRFRAYI